MPRDLSQSQFPVHSSRHVFEGLRRLGGGVSNALVPRNKFKWGEKSKYGLSRVRPIIIDSAFIIQVQVQARLSHHN